MLSNQWVILKEEDGRRFNALISFTIGCWDRYRHQYQFGLGYASCPKKACQLGRRRGGVDSYSSYHQACRAIAEKFSGYYFVEDVGLWNPTQIKCRLLRIGITIRLIEQ